jgi:hypothetical protein
MVNIPLASMKPVARIKDLRQIRAVKAELVLRLASQPP